MPYKKIKFRHLSLYYLSEKNINLLKKHYVITFLLVLFIIIFIVSTFIVSSQTFFFLIIMYIFFYYALINILSIANSNNKEKNIFNYIKNTIDESLCQSGESKADFKLINTIIVKVKNKIESKLSEVNISNSKESYTFTYINEIVSRFSQTQSVSSSTRYCEYLSGQLSEEISHKFIYLRYIAWLIPTIGFIGTVLGISQAIGSFNPQDTGMQLDGINEIIELFGLAFQTTLFALILSAIIIALITHFEKESEGLLLMIEQYVTFDFLNKYNDLDFYYVLSKKFDLLEQNQVNYFKNSKHSFDYIIESLENTVKYVMNISENSFKQKESTESMIESKLSLLMKNLERMNSELNNTTEETTKASNYIKQSISVIEKNNTKIIENWQPFLENTERLQSDILDSIKMNNKFHNKIYDDNKTLIQENNYNLQKIASNLSQVIRVKLPKDQIDHIIKDINSKIDTELRRLWSIDEKAETIFQRIKKDLENIQRSMSDLNIALANNLESLSSNLNACDQKVIKNQTDIDNINSGLKAAQAIWK